MARFLIQHKTMKIWLCMDGTLTNDQNNDLLFNYDTEDGAQAWLNHREIGDNLYCKETSWVNKPIDGDDDLMADYQEILTGCLSENGMNLYTDFIVVEHV